MKRMPTLLLALLGVSAAWLVASAAAQAAHEWTVVSNADSGPGSLREMINQANESDGDDIIRFASAMSIRLSSALPALVDAGITIDATFGDRASSDRASPDTAPQVWLDGAAAGDAAGLELFAPRGVVRGLGIGGFARYGIGVIGADADDALIEGNWIGFYSSGALAANRLSGVAVIAGPLRAVVRGNRIGGNAAAERTGHGIVIGGGGTEQAQITDNVIGIAADDTPAPNDDGILVVDSAQAIIRGNTIGHSRVAGIELRETRIPIDVDGNWIGLSRSGGLAPNDVGLFLGSGSAATRIGVNEANVIAGNRVGIAVEQGARQSEIMHNWIGLAPSDPSDHAAPDISDLPSAIVRPNRERGISVIAGAAQIALRDNYVAAGDVGIYVGDANTTNISLIRNVVAGSRQGRTIAAIDVASGTEITIGGERGSGNHVCGAEYGIRVANTEEVSVRHNAVGASAAKRVSFDSDPDTDWGIRLNDMTVRARVEENLVADTLRAAISVGGDGAQDNSLTDNHFLDNRLDIDLGADGPDQNDPGDHDGGPNGRLNHPVITDHTIRRISDKQVQSRFSGTATPGSYVEIYIDDRGKLRPLVRRSERADQDGHWTAISVLAPSERLRALAYESSGATSEFSDWFLPSQRLKLPPPDRTVERWFAWTGPDMPIADAFRSIERSVDTVWVWRADAQRWLGWSPLSTAPNGLTTLSTGDVVRLGLSDRRGWPPYSEYFVPAGGNPEGVDQLSLRQGYNAVSWLGGRINALDTLKELNDAHPGVIALVSQWNPATGQWEIIWPHLTGAWDPGAWTYPALWIRATRDDHLTRPSPD